MNARNLLNFLKPALDKGELKIDWNDEVFAQSCLTHAGQIKHEATRKAVEGCASPLTHGLSRTATSGKEIAHVRNGCALHFHARGVHRLRGHLAGAGDSAHTLDVWIQLRARHRAGGRDGCTWQCAYAVGEDNRVHRCVAGGGQRLRRICRNGADAGDVQVQRVAPGPQASQGGALMFDASSRDLLIQVSYFVTAALFILGLKRMSSPVTARSGITWAGAGMLVATAVTFAYPGMTNNERNKPTKLVGGGFAWWSGKRVAITD